MSYGNQDNSTSSNTRGSDPTYQQQQPPSLASQEQQIPQTILMDCNRANANLTIDGANSLHKWTCEFAGGIEIRTGDQISVNSAYLNSIGVGDLIAWTKSGNLQDNKCKWLIEYYCSNDGKNDKKEGYNLRYGAGKYPYPYDNKPAELYRYQNKVAYRDPSGARNQSGSDFSYAIDPYIGGRFFGIREVRFKTSHTLTNTFLIELHAKPFNQFVDNNYTNNPFALLKISLYDNTNTSHQQDPRKLIPIGTYFSITNKLDANAPPAQQGALNNNCLNYKFCCFGIFEEGGTYYVIIERPPFWTTNGGGLGNPDRSVTGVITLLGGRGTAGIVRGDITPNGLGRVFNCNIEGDYYKANTNYYLTTNRLHTLIKNTNLTQDEQKVAGVDDGILTTQFAYETQHALPLKSFTLPQSAFFKNRLIIHSLQTTRLATPEQDYIEFEIVGDYNTGATPNITSVADLIAKNDGRFNFTFSIAKPDGTQELVVAYAHGDPQGTASGGATRITYVSANRFIIDGGVIRDAENGTTIGNKTGFNPTPSGNDGTNTIFWCGHEHEFIGTYDTTNMDQQPFLSSTPYTAEQEAQGANGYPLQDTTNPIQYGLIELPPDNIEDTDNQSVVYNGYDFTNIASCISNFGKGTIHLSNGNTSLSNFILLYPLPQSTCEVKHYDFKDFTITDDYSSPSDIATTLTNQSHEIENARDSDGNVIPDSKAKGLIQSKFIIPVWTHPSFTEPANGYEMTAPDTTVLGGSYFLKKVIFNYPLSRGTQGQYNFTSGEALPNGVYKIYFRNGNTSINKPSLANGATAQGNLGSAGNRDFDVSQVPTGIPKAKGFNPQGQQEAYPITYIQGKNCFISQFVGANDLTFSWDDTDSRFAISYMGQVAVDNFDTKTATGGDMSATIFIPNPQGQNGYNYKAPQTRYGGVNVVNWCAYDLDNPNTPYGIQQQIDFTKAPAYTFDAETDEGNGGLGAWFLNLTLNRNPIGNRFWNKLGFSNNQLFNSNVGHSIDGVSGEYIPNGTTDILVDSAGSIITGGEPNENTPYGNAQSNWDGNTDSPVTTFSAGRTYGGVGGMSFNNHNVGYGIPNTAGRPLSFKSNHNTLNSTNKFFDFDATYNPDREEHTGYTYKSDTALLTADNLPIKTEEAYYYIVSDLVKTDFYVSNDNGYNTSIIGILSKLNAGGDFIYQYQAPQQFYAKRNAIITSITTEILTPKFTPPLSIDAFSSVVYQITRTNTTPNPLQDTPLMIQQRYFANMQNYINMMLKNIKKNQQPLTQTDRVQEIIKEVSGALVIPDDHQAEIIQRITANYERLGLARFRNDPTQYRQYLLQDPEAQNFLNDLATLNRIQNRQPQAPMGISDPESINPASIEATILNTTHEPQHTPVFLPPDQHQLALHIIDTLNDAHQRGQQYTQQDLGKLLSSVEGMTPETAQSIHELATVYLEGIRPVAPEGRAETPTGFEPQPVGATFGGATADQPTLIDTPIPVGLGTLTGLGQRELLAQLEQHNILGLDPERLARMKGAISSRGSTSGIGSDTETITAESERTRGSSSGYYSRERGDISITTSSDALGRIEEAEEEP